MTSGADWDAKTLSKADAWINGLDLEGFRSEIADLGQKLGANQGPEDVRHLDKMVLWSR